MIKYLRLFSLFLLFTLFSLNVVKAQNSPGNVSKTTAWFKVDNYTSGSSEWTNSVTNTGMQTLTTGRPPSNGELWNYNTTLSFNGSVGKNGFRATVNATDVFAQTQGTIIAIADNGETSSHGGVLGYRSPNGQLEVSMAKDINYFKGKDNSDVKKLEWNNSIGTLSSIRTIQFLQKNNRIYWNAFYNSILDNLDDDGQSKIYLDGNGTFTIGEITGKNTTFFKGSIAEVLVFAKNLDQDERLRAESYLAIKYGITLGTTTTPVNYTSSDTIKQTIWTGDNIYQNNIIGIGRDDISKLEQKQSHQRDDSVRVYLNDLKNNNLSNEGSFSENRSFVVVGSNTGALSATDASYLELLSVAGNCDLFSRIEREWKVQRTNMTEKFNMDIKLNASATDFNINPTHLRVLIDDDGDFSNGGTQCYFNGDINGTLITYANGTVTIKGLSTEHIPNNSTKYMTIASVNSSTPLPVGLTSFTAECNRNYVDLSWETETETNNNYFTIEKSRDGYSFETINILAGKGNSSSANTYYTSDFTTTSGIKYYRLSQTDFDGKETLLETIAVNCKGEFEVRVHPNPTTEGVYITLNNNEENYLNVVVYNMLGKQVGNRCINESTWIELPEENGVYLIKYRINDEVRVEKIVKY